MWVLVWVSLCYWKVVQDLDGLHVTSLPTTLVLQSTSPTDVSQTRQGCSFPSFGKTTKIRKWTMKMSLMTNRFANMGDSKGALHPGHLWFVFCHPHPTSRQHSVLVDVELRKSSIRPGSCWVFQNLTSWPTPLVIRSSLPDPQEFCFVHLVIYSPTPYLYPLSHLAGMVFRGTIYRTALIPPSAKQR
jgi:hypothetical protein